MTDPKSWQRHWHHVLDSVPDPDGEAWQVPDNLPDMCDDSRLLFNLWRVSSETRARAFSVLPQYERMLARVEHYLKNADTYPQLEPQAAVDLLKTGLECLSLHDVEQPPPNVEIAILTEQEVPFDEAFFHADHPFFGLKDEASDMALATTGETGRDAYFFLSEPLYMMTHSYGPSDWIRWPLCAKSAKPDVFEAPYLLELGGWSAGWSDDGVFLFDRRRKS